MMKIKTELPDATAQAAQAAGLLAPQALERLLTDALRKHSLEMLASAKASGI